MFGHGVHLPDSRSGRSRRRGRDLEGPPVVERGKPTNHEIAIFQPGPYSHYKATPAATRRPPFPRQPLYRTPIRGPAAAAAQEDRRAARSSRPSCASRSSWWRRSWWVRANTDDLRAPRRDRAGLPAARPLDLHPLTPPAADTARARAAPPDGALPAAAPPPAATAPAAAAAKHTPRPTATTSRRLRLPRRASQSRGRPVRGDAPPRPRPRHHPEAGAEGRQARPGDKSDGKPAGKPTPREGQRRQRGSARSRTTPTPRWPRPSSEPGRAPALPGTFGRVTPKRHMHIAPDQIDPDAAKVVRRLKDSEPRRATWSAAACATSSSGASPKTSTSSPAPRPPEIKTRFRNCRIIGRRFRARAHLLRPEDHRDLHLPRQPARARGRRQRRRRARERRPAHPPRQRLRHARGGRAPARLHDQRPLLRHRRPGRSSTTSGAARSRGARSCARSAIPTSASARTRSASCAR